MVWLFHLRVTSISRNRAEYHECRSVSRWMAAVGRMVLSVKGGGRGRKNGPFNGLIDLLPRRPTVVMVRNENVTLYRHLKPWRLTSRTMRSLFAKWERARGYRSRNCTFNFSSQKASRIHFGLLHILLYFATMFSTFRKMIVFTLNKKLNFTEKYGRIVLFTVWHIASLRTHRVIARLRYTDRKSADQISCGLRNQIRPI